MPPSLAIIFAILRIGKAGGTGLMIARFIFLFNILRNA